MLTVFSVCSEIICSKDWKVSKVIPHCYFIKINIWNIFKEVKIGYQISFHFVWFVIRSLSEPILRRFSARFVYAAMFLGKCPILHLYLGLRPTQQHYLLYTPTIVQDKPMNGKAPYIIGTEFVCESGCVLWYNSYA